MIETWPCRWCGKAYREHADQPGPNRPRCPCVGAKPHYKPLLPERAISLYAPWDYAIHRLGKDVENRGKSFPKTTGWVWLHASMWPRVKGERLKEEMFDEAQSMLDMASRANSYLTGKITLRDMLERRGRISGIVNITGHVERSASGWFVGPLGLQLGARYELPGGVPCKGAVGLWRVPADVTEQLRVVVTGGNP